MSELRSADDIPRPWVEIHALAAEHGDCIVLSYGDGKSQFRLVVDAGVAGTSDRLRRVLDASGDAVWELLVVTHIDLDHIGGTLSLFSDESVAKRFKDIWFNGRQHLELGRESMGVAEGRELAKILDGDGMSWNGMFGNGAVCLGVDDIPVYQTLKESGATITILSPAASGLAALRDLWDKWVKRQEQKAEKAAVKQSAAPSPSPLGSEVLSAGQMSITELADAKTDPDGSVPNGSSIAFIFEYGDFRILLAADAHASVLLKSAMKLTKEELRLDVFKLPHHGSAANMTKRLAQRLPARKYLLTTDGERHHTHPSDFAIARVLSASPDAELLFNYPNEAHARWAKRLPEVGYRFTVRAGEDDDGIRTRLEAATGQDAS